MRDPARELHAVEAASDLTARVVEHLAVLGRDQRGELVTTCVDQLAQAEHRRAAAAERGVAPVGSGGRSHLHRGVDLGLRRERDLGRLHATRGVEHGPAPRRGAVDPASADPVSDAVHVVVPRRGR